MLKKAFLTLALLFFTNTAFSACGDVIIDGVAQDCGHQIQDEGTTLVYRENFNFAGAGVSVADSGGKTVATIPAGGDSITWGDGLAYSSPTASVDYNTTNLKITLDKLNTIQDIATSSSPVFAGLGIGITPVTPLDIDTGSNTAGIRIRGLAETVEIADIYVGATGQLILSTKAGTGTSAYIDLQPEDDQYGLIVREGNGAGTNWANFYVVDAADDYLTINVNSATDGDALVITASDRVAIGTLTPASKLNVQTNSLGVTQTDTSGILLSNVTAAALNAQQISPSIRWRGQGWKTTATAASQSVDFREYVLPVQGAANPSGKLVWESSINGAAYTTLMSLSSTGELDVSGITLGITSSGTIEVTAAGGTNFRDLVTFFGGVEFGSDILFIRTSDTTFIIQDDIGPTVYFKVDTDAMSSTAGVDVVNLQVTNDGTYGNVLSGTYTPSLTNTTNVAASTARLATYMRVGNTVTVAGQLDIDPTSTGAVLLGISLPVASALTTVYQLGGAGSTIAITNESYGIEADATNDRASMKNIAVSIANHTVTYQFSYQIL